MAEDSKAKMHKTAPCPPLFGAHGSLCLPRVNVDSYNLELKNHDGFIGDRASKKAFVAILDKWRQPLIKNGTDPFKNRPSDEIPRKELDEALAEGDADAAGLIHAVIEDFSQELAAVARRFLKEKSWHDTERLVIGGGLRGRRIGEHMIGRMATLLKADDIDVDVVPITNHPDDAGLIGALFLAPEWVFRGHDAIVAVDIGGTNMRVGVVEFDMKKAPGFENALVEMREDWRHSEDEKVTREDAVEELIEMLGKVIRRAEKGGRRLAPFIGIGCPGIVESDGSIDRGTQNLPGNWASSRFNLPQRIIEGIPCIGDQETQVILHNDAVVHGLSEVVRMQDVSTWAVLTLGTGLGNARFTNRELPKKKREG
jgi:predicted NBD/HSP70 family sugar kinase